jgi:hypothetical protein
MKNQINLLKHKLILITKIIDSFYGKRKKDLKKKTKINKGMIMNTKYISKQISNTISKINTVKNEIANSNLTEQEEKLLMSKILLDFFTKMNNATEGQQLTTRDKEVISKSL